MHNFVAFPLQDSTVLFAFSSFIFLHNNSSVYETYSTDLIAQLSIVSPRDVTEPAEIRFRRMQSL